MNRTAILVFVPLVGALTSGCQVLTYTAPNAERFSRSSFCGPTAVSSLVVEADSNGLRRVELRGYKYDSSQTIAAVAEAAARGAVQGAR